MKKRTTHGPTLLQLDSIAARTAMLTALLSVAPCTNALAHGIAGNRYFPGTLTFDDPSVADEFTVSSARATTSQASFDQHETDLGVSGARLLTPTWALGFDLGRSRVRTGDLASSNQRSSDIFVKTELHRDDLNEELVSGSLGYGVVRTDFSGLGSSRNVVLPGVFFGKGFGNLPNSLAWLRPFAITGAMAAELPTRSSSDVSPALSAVPDFVDAQAQNVAVVHWGFAIEYSMLYRTTRFTPGKLPADEPLHQFVPLVEFQFDSPRHGKTSGTMNPGLSYVAQTWQFALEAVVPVAGNGSKRPAGVRAQLLFFLDDLIPSIFDKPLLAR